MERTIQNVYKENIGNAGASKIVIVLTNPNYENLTIDFRSYAQVHTRANKTTKSITIGENVPISSEEHNGY